MNTKSHITCAIAAYKLVLSRVAGLCEIKTELISPDNYWNIFSLRARTSMKWISFIFSLRARTSIKWISFIFSLRARTSMKWVAFIFRGKKQHEVSIFSLRARTSMKWVAFIFRGSCNALYHQLCIIYVQKKLHGYVSESSYLYELAYICINLNILAHIS